MFLADEFYFGLKGSNLAPLFGSLPINGTVLLFIQPTDLPKGVPAA